jgi:N-methylhydantoinase B
MLVSKTREMPASEPSTSSAQSETLNPITAEIIRHALLTIPNHIDVNITRTAYSPLVYEYKDYAVGIVDPEGRLISQSQGGIPLFVANALGVAVRDGLAVHGRDGIKPGDVIFSNHAGTLGQHLSNVVMYTPLFVGSKQEDLVAFMCVLVHWIDVGGMVTGSCAPIGPTEIYQEGIQYRSIKLWSAGKRMDDIYRIIEINTRFPRMLLGDIESQVAGCLLGRDMIATVVAKYGIKSVRAAIEMMWNRSERAARDAIRKIPDGVYRASSFLDNDGVNLDIPMNVDVKIEVAGDEMTVDLSGVADQVNAPINSGREGGAIAVARIAFKYLAAPEEPANDGSFRPLKVVIRDGTFLSASSDAPMGLYSAALPTVIDTIIRAMVDAAPDHVAGGHHGNFGIHTLEGRDPKTGERFYNLSSAIGGWGASKGHDGPAHYKTMAHGDTLDVPTEVQEALYPMRMERMAIRTDSGGAGEWRGGVGIEKVFTALAPCRVQVFMDRTGCPPWGILGGKSGTSPSVCIERLNGQVEQLRKANAALAPGERVHVLTSGGGGYGEPRRRKKEKVAEDVRLGYISRDAAKRIYGVKLGLEEISHSAASAPESEKR